MKNWLIKNFALSYESKVFGKAGRHPRATNWIVPLFLIAGIFTITREPDEMGALWLLWIPFTLTILLSFPIPKSNWVNYPAIIMFFTVWYFENLWTAIPLIFFMVGVFLDKTRFLFFSVKYTDLQDWEQRWQYLNRPELVGRNDETEPVGAERHDLYQILKHRYHETYLGPEKFVNAHRIIFPFLAILVGVIVTYIILS